VQQTRFIRRGNPRFSRPQRKRRFIWVRETISSVSAATTQNFDLLANYKSDMGITLNLPEITIWRVIMKIAIRFTLSPAVIQAIDGFLVAVFVDDITVFPTNVVLAPYGERYMTWEQLYAARTFTEGEVLSVTTNNFMIYKELDLKSKRRIEKFKDTLTMQIVATGNCVPAEISFTHSTLLRLPR
jgi:hypothetical protein